MRTECAASVEKNVQPRRRGKTTPTEAEALFAAGWNPWLGGRREEWPEKAARRPRGLDWVALRAGPLFQTWGGRQTAEGALAGGANCHTGRCCRGVLAQPLPFPSGSGALLPRRPRH